MSETALKDSQFLREDKEMFYKQKKGLEAELEAGIKNEFWRNQAIQELQWVNQDIWIIMGKERNINWF